MIMWKREKSEKKQVVNYFQSNHIRSASPMEDMCLTFQDHI